MNDAKNRVDAVQRQLRDLQGSRNNKLKLFGSWVPDLLQRVEQADRRGKFHHRPVGPIGKEKNNLFNAHTTHCLIFRIAVVYVGYNI